MTINKFFGFFVCLFSVLVLVSCGDPQKENTNNLDIVGYVEPAEASILVPEFSKDSAYLYIQNQVDFGPRIPNSQAHDSCRFYLTEKLKSFNWKVQLQQGEQVAHDGSKLKFTNIFASINPEIKRRVLLTAHWDTRPWGDNDDDVSEHVKPIDGANDGGSGVGVLLEIARILKTNDLSIGVDILLFDIEDYGVSSATSSFCYGSQFWAKNPTYENGLPYFAVNLDMVGDKDACFFYEGYSNQYARHVLDKVWSSAHALGHQNMFVRDITYPITDDHLYVNQAGIPCIDVIHRDKESGRFPDSWHTHDDTMDNIHKPTLKAVGQTLLRVLYLE
ncbi:MAG: hypothetical protein ACJA0Q_002103 [Saprospiraceae bacterium]|jgi:hypothetical protein